MIGDTTFQLQNRNKGNIDMNLQKQISKVQLTLSIFLLLITMFFIGCSKNHYTKKSPWKPKNQKLLDRRFERCPSW